jgi:serine protease Do
VRSIYILYTIAAAAGAVAAAGGEDDLRVTPVVKAYRMAKPAVVNISTEQIVNVGMNLGGGDLFDRIFPSPLVRRMPVQSIGSGFVIHPSGYIVTNAHVVRRARKIEVTPGGGDQRLPARVISSNQQHDLAVLKIDSPVPLAHLTLGRSDDLMEGETVIAVGNPLGYSHTVSQGIISALGRELDFGDGMQISELIQTDASINPGNSGGPLLNINARVIGITTAIRADAQNIGFAIPADTLCRELPSLLNFERLNRVVFGAKVAARHGSDGAEIVVESVGESSPASAALRKGDRIVSVDGAAVAGMPDWVCAMMEKTPEAPVILGVIRDGQRIEAAVTLLRRPAPDGAKLAQARLGMKLAEITPQLARQARLAVDEGLVVLEVEPGGPADAIGIRRGDIVTQLEQLHLATLESLGQLLEDVPGEPLLRIGVIRGNIRVLVSIRARAGGGGGGATRSADMAYMKESK